MLCAPPNQIAHPPQHPRPPSPSLPVHPWSRHHLLRSLHLLPRTGPSTPPASPRPPTWRLWHRKLLPRRELHPQPPSVSIRSWRTASAGVATTKGRRAALKATRARQYPPTTLRCSKHFDRVGDLRRLEVSRILPLPRGGSGLSCSVCLGDMRCWLGSTRYPMPTSTCVTPCFPVS